MSGTAALLLAAGESTRMGEFKALLPWCGTTLIEHQVSALLAGGASRCIVVLGHRAESLEPKLRGLADVFCVHNPDYREGKTTSLKTGLRALDEALGKSPAESREGAGLLLNVDQPRSTSIIRRIIELHEHGSDDSPRGDPPLITIPTHLGKGGHPIIFSTELLPEFMSISEESQGLKAVVRRHEAQTLRVDVDSPEVLLDLNTPQDYQAALTKFGSG